MDDYDVEKLSSEECVYLVASTFGNGDSPRNGEVNLHSENVTHSLFGESHSQSTQQPIYRAEMNEIFRVHCAMNEQLRIQIERVVGEMLSKGENKRAILHKGTGCNFP